jgi:hypothetical protein
LFFALELYLYMESFAELTELSSFDIYVLSQFRSILFLLESIKNFSYSISASLFWKSIDKIIIEIIAKFKKSLKEFKKIRINI